MLDQTTGADEVKTGREIRQAEAAEIVGDGPTGCGNLFSSTWLKVDAQSEDLETLHCFSVVVGDLPGDHSCGVKAQGQTVQFFSGLESDELAVVILLLLRGKFRKSVVPNRNPIGASRKVGKHKRAVGCAAHDALGAGSLRGIGIGGVEVDLCLGDGFAGIGAVDASRNLPQRRH
jgi:hypothetical protein